MDSLAQTLRRTIFIERSEAVNDVEKGEKKEEDDAPKVEDDAPKVEDVGEDEDEDNAAKDKKKKKTIKVIILPQKNMKKFVKLCLHSS